MFRKTTIPASHVLIHRVSSVSDWIERRDAANAKPVRPPRAKVHKSVCQLFGLEPLTMRSVLGVEV